MSHPGGAMPAALAGAPRCCFAAKLMRDEAGRQRLPMSVPVAMSVPHCGWLLQSMCLRTDCRLVEGGLPRLSDKAEAFRYGLPIPDDFERMVTDPEHILERIEATETPHGARHPGTVEQDDRPADPGIDRGTVRALWQRDRAHGGWRAVRRRGCGARPQRRHASLLCHADPRAWPHGDADHA